MKGFAEYLSISLAARRPPLFSIPALQTVGGANTESLNQGQAMFSTLSLQG